jgi:hypothetical protein
MHASLLSAQSKAKKRARMQVDEMVEMQESVHAVRTGTFTAMEEEKERWAIHGQPFRATTDHNIKAGRHSSLLPSDVLLDHKAQGCRVH